MGIIADVAALARAGYTMADIRELMQTKEPEEPKQNSGAFQEESKAEVETRVVSQTVDTQIETTEAPKDTTDYKAKYEQLLAKTQADNRKANFGGEPDDRTDEQKAIDILAAIF